MKYILLFITLLMFFSCIENSIIYESDNGQNKVEIIYYKLYGGLYCPEVSYKLELRVNKNLEDFFTTNYNAWKSTNEFSNAVITHWKEEIKKYESMKM